MTFSDATGGFDGTAFTGVSLSNPSFSATLSYTPTDVMLNLNTVSSVPGPIAGAGLAWSGGGLRRRSCLVETPARLLNAFRGESSIDRYERIWRRVSPRFRGFLKSPLSDA